MVIGFIGLGIMGRPMAENLCKAGFSLIVNDHHEENVAKQIMLSQGTTRPEVVKLLSSLNIDLDLQLSKTDTANLLACLLTANQKQLQAIYDNDKTPLAIKIVVKRLMNDSKIGEIQTVEKLWDRIFGKTGMMLDLPQESKAAGIIPNTPVSREAYILIRESLLK